MNKKLFLYTLIILLQTSLIYCAEINPEKYKIVKFILNKKNFEKFKNQIGKFPGKKRFEMEDENWISFSFNKKLTKQEIQALLEKNDIKVISFEEIKLGLNFSEATEEVPKYDDAEPEDSDNELSENASKEPESENKNAEEHNEWTELFQS